LVPSGLAALATVALALLKSGDELLLPDNAYGPNKALAEGELRHYGITHQLYDPMNPDDLAGKINARTRVVWLEAPGSVSMEFPDLPELVRRCKAQSVLCALDNTWGAGLAFKPFDLLGDGSGEQGSLAVDISAHALTKYPSGGGDVLMGSVVTRDEALHHQLLYCHMRVGFGVAGNDAEAVLRGLPSMALRYQAQDAATRALAGWMQGQAAVAEVRHPALAGSPGHAAWLRDCSGAACLFSAIFKPEISQAQIDLFCDSLKLFKLGYSWAGPMSLCAPYDVPSIRSVSWPHRGGLVRFSVGLESVADLQADLSQALAKISA
jgi:cystathionine beta-lyase